MRYALALALVIVAIEVTMVIGAEEEAPGRLLMLAVLGTSLLGRGPGLTAAAASVAGYLYLAESGEGWPAFDDQDALIGLVTYVLAAGVVALLVSRTTALRQMAESREQEAKLRLVQSQRLMAEREALDERARQASVEAEMSRARAAFFAAAGHNLRTPLAAVQAAVSTLLSPGAQLSAQERVEMLQTIRDETERLSRLVTKVLDMSRIRGGGIEPRPEPVDLEGLVQAAVHRLGASGDNRFTLDIDPGLAERTIMLDEIMAEQILLNVLENATRFAPAGSPIEVTAGIIDGGAVELRVADHGPGVPVAERERIFDEFHRISRSVESEGTGLGLAIVRALTEAHDGTARCEETEGGGATFVLTFPTLPTRPHRDVAA